MKTTIIGLLLLATASVNAQEKAQTYQWQMLPATVRRRDMDMISSLLPKKAARHPSSFLSACRTVTIK